jgi:hypothetical protein
MNLSFKDLFEWLIALDQPTLSEIWTWLITVPWWLALLTVAGVWVSARILAHLVGELWDRLCDRSLRLGRWAQEWQRSAREASRMMVARGRAMGQWLLRLLAIR